ncbi:ParA family protein [Permianibacter sp. IMCC34836]|uniref:ParA family protein n=1 Tax=Permianibacter fluminis TaxID=2738515 RepID=UPI001553E7E7|nr:ParA family protein [Permianibacter fluminis]NQD38012.1 ParA family protein [Permianibacter fluminis]
MRIWAVANQKGGVGKTTTSVSLGGLLASKGARVLLLDLDPHASLTAYFGANPEGDDPGIFDLFTEHRSLSRERILQCVKDTGQPGLQFIPGQVAMATLEKLLAGQDGQGLIITRMLAMVQADYDNVLIDCPPVLGVLMVNALAACDYLLMPVQTEFLALQGLERMLRTLQMIERSRKLPIPYRIIPTMFDRRTRAAVQCLRQLRDGHGDKVWRGVVPVDTRLREASRSHLPPNVFAPESRAVEAYAQLMRDIIQIQRISQAPPVSQAAS